MILTAKELDVMVILVKVKRQITAALWAFQIATKGAGLLRYGRPPAPDGLQALYLFLSPPVNNGLIDIMAVFLANISRETTLRAAVPGHTEGIIS